MNTVLSYEIINGMSYPLRIPIEKMGLEYNYLFFTLCFQYKLI
jgi:hypothetical protein